MDLSSLFAIEKTKEICGVPVKIKQVALGDIPMLVEFVSKVMGKDNTPVTQKIISIIQNDFKSIKILFSKLTDISEENVDRLNLEASVLIIREVIEENADFFMKNVAPQIKNLVGVMDGMSKSKS